MSGELATVGIGHNGGVNEDGLSDDKQAALFFQHRNKVMALKDRAASINSELRNAYKAAKADNCTKKDIDFSISLENDEDGKIETERRRQDQIARWLNIPLGAQTEMDFGDTAGRAYAEGKAHGMADKPLQEPPFAQGDGREEYMQGYHDGQTLLNAANGQELLRPSSDDDEEGGVDEFDASAEDDS